MFRFFRPIPFLACVLVVGCGEFRGIPSHGGGKRFDEEQRVVAGAIRQSLADMDLRELSGKRVQISLESIAGDGGGNIIFPGINGINAGVNANTGNADLVQIVPAAVPGGNGYLKNANSNNSFGGSTGINYNPQTQYSASAMSSVADLSYLHAALEMKSRHVGLSLVGADPEAVLYVMVDVLGTNRSHADRFVSSSEKLSASCELTYYAQDAKTGKLIFEARRSSAAGVYDELRFLGDKDAHVSRSLFRTRPTRLPIDELEKPTTQPVVPMEIYVDTKE